MTSSVFSKLVAAYAKEDLEVMSGLNSTLVHDFFQAPFTWLVREGRPATDGLGVSPAELYFFETLAAARPARKILVIGNAFGWSTLALALANEGARVVAMDSGADENALEGLDVTNRLARQLGVDVTAVQGTSPDDVADVVSRWLGFVDLAFIDGFHVSEQLVADWRAVRPFLRDESIVVMHDVLMCDMTDGFRRVVSESGWQGSLLYATTSGIGVVSRRLDGDLGGLLMAFEGGPRARQVVQEAARAKAGVSGHAQRAAALAWLRQAQEETVPGEGRR